MDDTRIPKGTLTVKDRKSISLDCVSSIEGFDDTYISLATDLGRTVIEGKGLKVESMSKDTGSIYITGHINSIYYSEPKSSKSLLNRIFK